MSESIRERLIRLRPFLWHLTAASNLPRIRRERTLHSSSEILRRAGRVADSGIRRARHLEVRLPDGDFVHLRDQSPLHAGNIAFADGWGLEMLVAHLNEFVFFWPGVEAAPIAYGLRHFERYRNEPTVLLRFPTVSVLTEGPTIDVRLSRYNSGSPRCSSGKKSPRGPETFRSIDGFVDTPSAVVEVVVKGSLPVPPGAMFSDNRGASWSAL